jgi:WXXGXW repeat (2 copies)
MKRIIFLTLLASALFLTNACNRHYAETEPVFLDAPKPTRPSEAHVWIDGDWAWNKDMYAYVRKDGYWVVPNKGRTYVAGHWSKSRAGHYWVPGQWRKTSK